MTSILFAIRLERAGDEDAIGTVVRSAFASDTEARLVDLLRKRGKAVLSLVAIADDRIVGHILFSPITVETSPQTFRGLGLAPVAVLPEFQNRGIGSRLIRDGLERCKTDGYDVVVVLGHPAYYRRFGFRIASECGLENEYNATDAFMILELKPSVGAQLGGLVRYVPEFAEIDC